MLDRDLTQCSQWASGVRCKLAFHAFDVCGCLGALFTIMEIAENHIGF